MQSNNGKITTVLKRGIRNGFCGYFAPLTAVWMAIKNREGYFKSLAQIYRDCDLI